MSTKNLARTAIEGGRSHWSKSNRENKNGAYRARERELLHQIMTEWFRTRCDPFAPAPTSPTRN
jgi:hypothetical protein